jgi:hypothetical protein
MTDHKWINRILIAVALLALSGLIFAFFVQVKARKDGSESVFKYKNSSLKNLRPFFNEDWIEENFPSNYQESASYIASWKHKSDSFIIQTSVVPQLFNAAYNVASVDSNRNDVFQVLKYTILNCIDSASETMNAHVYVLSKDPLSLHKMSMTSHSEQGSSFKGLVIESGKYQMDYNTYWDEQGKGKKDIGSNLLFEDQLGLSLRALNFSEGLQFDSRMYASILQSKVSDQEVVHASFTVSSDSVEISGKRISAWKVQVDFPTHNAVYLFDQEGMHALLAYSNSKGFSMKLKAQAKM